MKWSFLLFSSFLCLQAIAQYPATGNKMRLGWQTTGDGLVYRGAIGDTATLDPSGINNAWMLLDTANGNLYAYRAKAWRLVSGGGGSVSDTLTGEVKGPLDSTYIDTVANIIFRLDSTTVGVGEVKYNDTQGSLIQGLKGGNVTNVIGQQIHQRVLNKTGSPLAKGEAVYLQGSQGNRITVAKAIATIDSTSANTFGIVAESIANNQSGYIITEGLITGLNTNSLTEGMAVYLSPTVAGGLTTTKPQAPDHGVYIGVCVKQNNGSGELFVKIRNGQELEELHDVRITSPASNASLYYNAAQGIWRDTGAAVLVADTSAMLSPYLKKQDTLSLSNRINTKLNISDTSAMLTNYINVVDTAAMLTNYINIADTATMLSSYISNADTSVFARDFQISGTSGQVAYFNAANAVTSDTAFRWSADNRTLGINTSTTSGANIIIKNSQEPSRSTVVAAQTFAADTTNWTRGTGWTFNGTVAVATAATGNLTYTPALTITSGNAYEVTYTLSGYSAGTLTAAVGNATYALPTHNATANVVVLLPTSATGGFRFTTSTFTGNLDNVSVVQIASPAPVLLAGQDDNSTTLYSPMRIPNSTSISFGGGAVYNTGINNNFIGTNAGRSNTTGVSNNFFGNTAGLSNTTGTLNNFFGQAAGALNTSGQSNNFFGNSAGYSNTTGSSNNFFGNTAGYSNTIGVNNSFFGSEAGYNNTSGGNNNFFGNTAGRSNTTGLSNNFFGFRAGFANTTGNNNIFMGNSVAVSNTSGSGNIFLGVVSGVNNKVGSDNIFVGNSTGSSNTTGSSNVAIGPNAINNTIAADTLTGSNNIAIGNSAADNIRAAAAGNVAIGNQVDLPTSNGSNQGVYQNVLFFTGASGTGTTIAAGSRAGIKTNAPASDFHVAGEVRIDDLKPTGAPRNIVGSSSTGDLSTMAWGNGLTVSVGDTTLRVDTSLILPKVNVSGTANYLAKFTGANTIGNSVIQDNGTNVGISASPSSFKLDINGSTHTTGDFYADRAARSASAGFVSAQTNNRWLAGMISNSGSWHVYDLLRSTSVMTLDSATGNVGINTTTPSRRLHVEGETRISDLTTDPATRIVGADADGDLDAITIGNGVTFSSDTLKADTSVLATKAYVTDNAISTVYIPINLYAPGDTVANTTNSKAFFLVHSGLNGYCIDSYTVKAFSGSGTADIQIDKNGTGGNLQAISGTTTATKDTNIALATGDYIRGQVFNLSGTLVGLGLTLEIKKTCN